MDIDEFLSTLPSDVISGENVSLPEQVIRRILKFASLKKTDVFYHLGCGNGKAVEIAAREFGVKKAIGVERDKETSLLASKTVAHTKHAKVLNSDMMDVDISDATVILFWSGDTGLIRKMERRFSQTLPDGARVITIWSPLGLNLPDKSEFPFFICAKPFRRAKSVREQIKAIYGNECIDFTAAWLLAERYIEQLESVQAEYQRFLNIIQSMVIWANAWNMGVACEEEIPPPVDTYMGILKSFFDIDLSNLIIRDRSPTAKAHN